MNSLKNRTWLSPLIREFSVDPGETPSIHYKIKHLVKVQISLKLYCILFYFNNVLTNKTTVSMKRKHLIDNYHLALINYDYLL